MYRHGVRASGRQPAWLRPSSKIYSLVDYIVVNLDDNKLKFLNHVLLEYGKVLNKMDKDLNYFYPDSLYVKYFEINI